MSEFLAQNFDPAWVYLGSTLGLPWANLGPTLGQPWANLGPTLGQPWAYLGPTLGLPCLRLPEGVLEQLEGRPAKHKFAPNFCARFPTQLLVWRYHKNDSKSPPEGSPTRACFCVGQAGWLRLARAGVLLAPGPGRIQEAEEPTLAPPGPTGSHKHTRTRFSSRLL